MEPRKPATPEDLAEALAAASAEGKRIELGGAQSKRRLFGRLGPADVRISTIGLTGIVEYEPLDLTISVLAGTPFSELSRRIGEDGLILPLDPPYFADATVGGVVASNCSGPRRRFYGTSRDLVIGTRFATLDGRLVQSGGMVVKNAAGLEMGKLLVGSNGTLAAIAVLNFRLAPKPPFTRTFVIRHNSLAEAIATRDLLTRGVLQPIAVDLLNPAAAMRVGLDGFCVISQAGGNKAVMDRWKRELPAAEALEGSNEDDLWTAIREFTPAFLAEHVSGAVLRASGKISEVGALVDGIDGSAVARAGSGVVYGYFTSCEAACSWAGRAAKQGRRAVVEYVSEDGCEGNRWPLSGADFTMMERIKQMFDPRHLLNKGKLYGRL